MFDNSLLKKKPFYSISPAARINKTKSRGKQRYNPSCKPRSGWAGPISKVVHEIQNRLIGQPSKSTVFWLSMVQNAGKHLGIVQSTAKYHMMYTLYNRNVMQGPENFIHNFMSLVLGR